jgi:hypothetical protein
MQDIDKNDVNISALFRWGTEFEIDTPKGKKPFWMRIVGDADLNRARVYGLRNSAELRRQLKDENSDERLALVPDFDVTDREKAVEIILLYKVTELTEIARKKLDLKYPKEPKSDAELEEHEEYQKEVDGWAVYVEKAITKSYNKEVGLEKKRLNKLSEDELLKVYYSTLINKLCENEMMRGFQDMCVYFASYKDAEYKNRLFANLEEFLDLPTEVKEQFYVFYTTLNLSTEELKK